MFRVYITAAAMSLALIPAFAEAADVHQVVPRAIDRTVEPRDIFTEEVTVTNHRSYRISVFPTVNELSVTPEGDILDYIPNVSATRTEAVTSWVEVTRAGVRIDPGETVTIPVSFTIHPQAQPGEYYAFIGFGQDKNRPAVEAKVLRGEAPGMIVRLAIPKKDTTPPQLSSFTIDRLLFDVTESFITYTLTNTSAETLVPEGEIIIYSNRGAEITSLAANPEAKALAAGEVHTFTVAAPNLSVPGKYKAWLSVQYRGVPQAVINDTAFFYFIPLWWLIWFMVGIIIFIVLATLWWRTKYHGHTVYEAAAGQQLPLHVYRGESTAQDHDINLKS